MYLFKLTTCRQLAFSIELARERVRIVAVVVSDSTRLSEVLHGESQRMQGVRRIKRGRESSNTTTSPVY